MKKMILLFFIALFPVFLAASEQELKVSVAQATMHTEEDYKLFCAAYKLADITHECIQNIREEVEFRNDYLLHSGYSEQGLFLEIEDYDKCPKRIYTPWGMRLIVGSRLMHCNRFKEVSQAVLEKLKVSVEREAIEDCHGKIYKILAIGDTVLPEPKGLILRRCFSYHAETKALNLCKIFEERYKKEVHQAAKAGARTNPQAWAPAASIVAEYLVGANPKKSDS